MIEPAEHAHRIRAIGLPEQVVAIALDGGSAVHPVLEFRAQSTWAPAWAVVEEHPGLLPLWTSGTVVAFADPDGSFTVRDAEVPDEVWERYDDFAGLVRWLLTDLWEDDADDGDRRDVAEALLPADQVAAALVPEER